MRVAIFGATGLVGGVMLKVLEERNFPITELIPIASPRSAGTTVTFRGEEHTVVVPEEGLKRNPQIALFSAGGGTSQEWAPKFAEQRCYVIDNSSAWRMDPTKKLIIPEINGDDITVDDYIIANPNCTIIPMILALAPLHQAYKIRRIVVSTYQAVTGTGKKALDQLLNEKSGNYDGEMAYPYIIEQNCIPQCDDFTENGYTKEEMKQLHETRKILGDPTVGVSATTVRVPVVGGHSASINVEFEQPFTVNSARWLMEHTQGIEIMDNPAEKLYPMPWYINGRDEVFVGRIRIDLSNPQALNMWVVSDNLRKGAATNTVQIAEKVIEKFFSN